MDFLVNQSPSYSTKNPLGVVRRHDQIVSLRTKRVIARWIEGIAIHGQLGWLLGQQANRLVGHG